MTHNATTKTIAGDILRQSSLVRAKLVADGHLPQGLLRAEIDTSWRRSFEYGLSCIDEEAVGLYQCPDLEQLRIQNRLLIDAATPELEYLIAHQGKHGLIVLGNADATVLAVEGQTEYLKAFELRDLAPGSCWSESLRGTNAVGTAVIEGRPTLINCGEHYLERLSRFSCTSVPIKNPQGQVVGVIDVTREGALSHPQDSLTGLILAASNIESRLFTAMYPQHLVLAFHNRQQYLGSAWHGLIALGLEGEVVAINNQGSDLLAQSRSTLIGRRCQDLFGGKSAQFVSRMLQGMINTVQTASGEYFFKAVQIPRLVNQPAPVAATKQSAEKMLDLTDIAGSNSRFSRSLRMAQQGLVGGLPILLLGETGTGKEVVARALHQASARATKPFVAVNCAAIPEGLIESELFGYREGAFTGSRKGGMVGRLLQAHNGTLFLDEIGDMPLSLQARLLRVLQERKVAPLGGGDEVDLDIAVICATHCELKQLVQEKSFREDLYYRVNGVSLRLPSLREREDLDDLIRNLLEQMGAAHIQMDHALGELFAGYDWPGNIRQLQMVLRAALAMHEGEGQLLGLEHLTDSLLDELTASCRQPCGRIRENELELIRNSLDQHGGNVSAAADALGISRATLYRKLKQLR